MKIQIEHTVAGSTPEKAETYQITVRSASYADRAYYQVLAMEGMEQFKARLGFEIDEDSDNTEAISLRNLCYYRAEMLCVIDRERTADGIVYMCDYRNGTPDAEWQRKTLPADWLTFDGFADKLPTPLFDAWLAATRQLNAGVLGTIPDRFLPVSRTETTILDG